MQEAMLLSIGRFICTVPWFVVCCVPFYPQRRVSRSVMGFVITTVSILFFLSNFFLRLYGDNYIYQSSIVYLILYAVIFGLFLWGFRSLRLRYYIFPFGTGGIHSYKLYGRYFPEALLSRGTD